MGRKAAGMMGRGRVTRPEPAGPVRGALAGADPDADLELDSDDDIEADKPVGKAATTDNVGEQSVEINVEELIASLEAETRQAKPANACSGRRKLEDFLERQRIARELQDLDDFDI
jgi:hypothetical protein